MDKELLAAAQRGLQIADVSLYRSVVWMAEDYLPRHDSERLEMQSAHRAVQSDIAEIINGEDKDRFFRVFVSLGLRWIRAPKAAKQKSKNQQKAEEPVDVRSRIEATFIAEYKMTEDVSDEARREFALHNAPWHVWPYWREYVASQCARLNMPKVTMPVQIIGAQSSDEPAQS